MATPTVEIMCTPALERALDRHVQCVPVDFENSEEEKELRILYAEVRRARALQRFNNDRQIKLALPVGG